MKKLLNLLFLLIAASFSATAQDGKDFYIVQVAAVADESTAQQTVKALQDAGKEAAYLWIPDYPSLSGTALFSVYLGPFKTQQACEAATIAYRKEVPAAYGLLVSQRNKRVQINGKGQVVVSDNPPRLHIAKLPPDENEHPSANVSVLVGDKTIFLKKITGDIRPVAKEEFSSMDIPAAATAACGGWWAGGGDYYYLTVAKTKVLVYEGWQDEGQTDKGYHWKKVKEITR